MTKPATLPRWSTDLSNMTAPSSGQMDTGWTPGQDGVSDYDNWVKYWTYTWLKWVDDGCPGTFTTNNLVVTGSTVYNGITNVALTASVNNLDPAGNGSLDGINTVRITPSAEWAVYGLIAGADGQEVEIINTGSFRIQVQHNSTFATVGNKLKFASDYLTVTDTLYIQPQGSVRLRYDSGVWVAISLVGCMCVRNFIRPGLAGRARPTLAYDIDTTGKYLELQGVGDLFFDIDLPTGSIFLNWAIVITKNTNASVTLAGQMYSVPYTGGVASPVGTGDSNGTAAPGLISLTGNVAGEEVFDLTKYYYVRLDASGTWGITSDYVYGFKLSAYVPI